MVTGADSFAGEGAALPLWHFEVLCSIQSPKSRAMKAITRDLRPSLLPASSVNPMTALTVKGAGRWRITASTLPNWVGDGISNSLYDTIVEVSDDGGNSAEMCRASLSKSVRSNK